MKYTEEIDALVTMTVRWPQGGALVAKASASCEYQKGSTASAEVDLPESTILAVRAALEAALPAIEASLGKKLAHSRHEAVRVGAALGEVPPSGLAGPAKKLSKEKRH